MERFFNTEEDPFFFKRPINYSTNSSKIYGSIFILSILILFTVCIFSDNLFTIMYYPINPYALVLMFFPLFISFIFLLFSAIYEEIRKPLHTVWTNLGISKCRFSFATEYAEERIEIGKSEVKSIFLEEEKDNERYPHKQYSLLLKIKGKKKMNNFKSHIITEISQEKSNKIKTDLVEFFKSHGFPYESEKKWKKIMLSLIFLIFFIGPMIMGMILGMKYYNLGKSL